VRYELKEIGQPNLSGLLKAKFGQRSSPSSSA